MARLRNFFIFLIPGFLGGVCLASFIDWILPWLGLFLLLALFFLILFFLFARQKLFLVIAIIFVGVILGLLHFNFTQKDSATIPDCSPVVKPCVGFIVNDPDRRDASTRLIIRLDSSSNKILVITDNFTNYAYGDKVELVGKIEKPENFLTDEGKVFDYQNYLLAKNINFVSYYPKLKTVSPDNGFFIKKYLFKLKNSFLSNLRRVLPEPSASLAGGLILGDKGGLGDRVEEEFRLAGVSHIVVLSGYNITIIAENVLLLFSWLSPALAWLFGLLAIFLFVIMVGGEAAVVRAALMGMIALVARRYGRAYDAGVALIVAGFLMVLWNPRLLAFDLGFQLSFLATLGLIYLSPVVEFFINKISRGVLDKIHLSALKEIIVTTTGAQLAVYPWLLYKVGNASLVGFVSNIFILPAIPLAMLGSFLTSLSGFFSGFISSFFSYPTYFLLAYILKVAHFFASLV